MRTQLLALLGVSWASTVWGQTAITPLSVCTLLENRLSYNGKLVTVRGEVEGSAHGAWLVGKCAAGVVTHGYRWPDAIVLESPSQAIHPVDFVPDRASAELIRRQFEKLNINRKDVRIFLTYVGIFESRPDSELYVSGAGRPTNGFGHLASAPAQLIVKTLRDLEVKSRKKKP